MSVQIPALSMFCRVLASRGKTVAAAGQERIPASHPVSGACRWAMVAGLPFLLLQAGCNTLPSSGPVQSQITAQQKDPKKNSVGFRIIPVTPELVTLLHQEQPPTLASLESTPSTPSQNDRIGPGDDLQISIYEMGNGLFNASNEQHSTSSSQDLTTSTGIGGSPTSGATASALPPVRVNAAGNIVLPYIGDVHVSGLTTTQIAERISAGMKKISRAPQVVVRTTSDLTNSIIIYGEVTRSGRVPLTPNKERVLDIVALSGGATHAAEDTLVQLTRDDRIVQAPLKIVEDTPEQNILLQSGDRLQLLYMPRNFTVFGASEKISEIPFSTPDLSLAEGLARVGGPSDGRADPNAVYLFRFEDRAIAQKLNVPSDTGQSTVPIVYQLDMMNPANYFLAQDFPMRNHDLIYIANAKINNFNKFFNLLSTIVSPGITAAYMAR